MLARGLRPLLLIHPELAPDFAGLDSAQPNAVVVGDAGDHFRYATLNHAFRLAHGGAPLLALGRNRYFQEADGLSLDAGPFVAALEYAAGVAAELLGKPAPALFAAALRAAACPPGAAVMIGDDVEADVNGAPLPACAASWSRPANTGPAMRHGWRQAARWPTTSARR